MQRAIKSTEVALGKTIIIFHTFPVLITIPAYNLLSSICCSTKVSIHDFLLDFRRLRVFKSNFRRILSTTTNCQVSTHHWNFLTSSSLRAWKNLQRPFPLDSISSVFLLKPVKPRLESLTCRLALPLLVASSSTSSDSLHIHSMWHKSY